MRTRSLRVIALLLCFFVGGTQAAFAGGAEEPSPAVHVVHDQIVSRGIGHKVKLIRADGSQIQGRIVAIRDDSVDLSTKGTAALSVNLAEVSDVKGPGLSTGAKIGIGVGIGVVICVGIAAIIINHEVHKPIY